MLETLFLALAVGGGTAPTSPGRIQEGLRQPAGETPAAFETGLQAPEGIDRTAAPAVREPRIRARDAQPSPSPEQQVAAKAPQQSTSGIMQIGKTPEVPMEEVPFFYTVTIKGGPMGTGTGYKERFMIFAPDQSKPSPLLVVFHKFGTSELDAWVNTQFFQEAWSRGWHIMAPLSSTDVHFGNPLGQQNTQVALEWMTDNFNIRPDRIYGVGFSMGGGAALSYAAQHVDPTKPMFAAVVDHTGGISLNDTYLNEPSAQFIFDFFFGDGTPGSADPWKMTAASMFDFNPGTLAVDDQTNMARNLKYMPIKVFRVSNDPLAYLKVQCDVFANYLTNRGFVHTYEIVDGHTHLWAHLSERKSLVWLSKKKLTLPSAGRVLAHQDGRFFFFTVDQIAAETFSPFDWTITASLNKLRVWRTGNLTSLTFDTVEAGLDPSQMLTIDMATGDGVPVTYVLRDIAATPTTVERDSVPTTAYLYDPVEKTLTLQETDGGNHLWEVTP